MSQRILELRSAFKKDVFQGLKGGIRVLDHAVCSALIILQHSTQYYVLSASVQAGRWRTSPDDFIRKLIERLEKEQGNQYRPYWWMAAILWATAATAIHNMAERGKLDKLTLREDPLAYLGVLVDAVQQWDRYAVVRGDLLDEKVPLEGHRVFLGQAGHRCFVDYGDRDRAEEVRAELDRALAGWRGVLEVRPG
jgi:hypothetical protein